MSLHNPPPDPNPRAPRVPVPDMSWDCHIHLLGPAHDWPFESHSPYVSDDALPEDYLRLQQVLGLRRAVIVSAGGYGREYSHLRSVLERFGAHFRGIILPPTNFRAAEIVPLRRLGVRGIRMFAGPAGHEWSHLPQIEPHLARLVNDAGWHVQYQSLVRGHLESVADQLLALPAFTTILRMLDTGRVWLKLSGPMRCSDHDFPYDEMLPFAQALARHAPEKLLWGSDWPHVQLNGRGMPNDGDLVDLLARWVPDAATRHRILVLNPQQLYD
jgi:predicted TIM-barrel fold metal-dependent hydrolase